MGRKYGYYSYWDDENVYHTVLDEAALDALPRKVGHMRSVVQVRAMADDLMRHMNEHRDAAGRGEYCPHCVTAVERKYERCAEYKRLDAEIDVRVSQKRIASPEGYALLRVREKHVETCPTCQIVLSERTYLQTCPQANQWHREWQIYASRAGRMEYREEQRCQA